MQAETHGRTKNAEAAQPGAAEYLPNRKTLQSLRKAAASCQGCDLYRDATQTVFGQGSPGSRLVLVGEQPGDMKDRQGRPFVGPAGKVLHRALAAAEIAEDSVYLTNAVKHFRWRATAGNKRRIHQKPTSAQIQACSPWLKAELGAVDYAVLVALGATAARVLFGPRFVLSHHRGHPLDTQLLSDAARPTTEHVLATIHPSAVLRSPNRDEAYSGLVRDLKVASQLMLT